MLPFFVGVFLKPEQPCVWKRRVRSVVNPPGQSASLLLFTEGYGCLSPTCLRCLCCFHVFLLVMSAQLESFSWLGCNRGGPSFSCSLYLSASLRFCAARFWLKAPSIPSFGSIGGYPNTVWYLLLSPILGPIPVSLVALLMVSWLNHAMPLLPDVLF